VTYLIEYLGEFEFIFETILDNESGDQMGSFDAKKPPTKISCLGPFNLSSCCCSDRGVKIFTSHVCEIGKGWQCPKVCWALVPRRVKVGSHCRAKE
jgi:hypothetical protein